MTSRSTAQSAQKLERDWYDGERRYRYRGTNDNYTCVKRFCVVGSDILEVSIGIVFVFVLVSTICSAVREGIEAWLKTRASFLEYGIRQLLNDPHGLGIAKELFNHPLIAGLYADEYATPNAKLTDAAA